VPTSSGSPVTRMCHTPPASTQDDLYTRFFHDTYDAVIRYAVNLCRNEALAKDLTQDAYLKVFLRHKPSEALKPRFVFQALRWSFLDNIRKDDRDRMQIGELGKFEVEKFASDPGKVVPDRLHVLWLMECLNPRQKEIYFFTEVALSQP